MTKSAKTAGTTGTRAKSAAARLPADVKAAVASALDKKADDLIVLDLRKASGFTDYFVICTGQSARQIRAIADGVIEQLKAAHARPSHIEGYERSEWVLIDCFDFIVHIFSPETRTFYGLERLWGSAERVTLRSAARAAARPSSQA
ncbi:MAG TPA: ribosome silencing factor [Vicinamibacterales bacterium]|nr:ribosome silencing factor [Vicinamibacterales bacterium]